MKLETLVARRLRTLKISQTELALRAGVNKVYVSELVSGKKKAVQDRFLPRLAYALEIEPAEITAAMAKRRPRRDRRKSVTQDIPLPSVPKKPARFFLERGIARDRHKGKGALPFIEQFPPDFLAMDEQQLQSAFDKISLSHILSVGSYAFPRSAFTYSSDSWPDTLYVAVRHLPIHVGEPFVAWCAFAPPGLTPILGRYNGEDESYVYVISWTGTKDHSIPISVLRGAHRIVATLDGSAFRLT